MLIIFHQGRVGSTALSSILAKQSNTYVFGEIFSGHLFRRLLFIFMLKLFGLKSVLSVIRNFKSFNKESIFEIKTHQLPFTPCRLFYEINILASDPNVNFLVLTRSGSERLNSIKKVLKYGSYHFNTNQDLDNAFNSYSPISIEKCWFNGRYDLISLHEKRSEFDDDIICSILKRYPLKTLILNYDQDLRDDIKYGVLRLNKYFDYHFIAYDSDFIKVPHG